MEALASISIVVGAMLAAIAALGINRFGDVLSRMHAATKATTLGLALTLIGAAIAIPATGAVVKLLLVIVFQFMTAPVGAHLIGRASFPPSGHDRTSLPVFIRDQPGALYRILEPLARRGISMNRIESRPAHGALWQYAFFIEVSGHAGEAPLEDALGEIDDFAGDVRVLGSYPVAVP